MRLIDADVLIEKCGDWYVEEGTESGFIGTLENLLATEPTVQPEPQWGRFERKRDGVFCSVCHNGWEFITGVPVEVEREYRYCPHCGAKMIISTK